MRGRIVFLISLFSMLLLFGFGLSDTSAESRRIDFQPTKTPLPKNKPADVESVTFDKNSVVLFCEENPDSSLKDERVRVTTVASDKDNRVLIYNYEVSGGRIVGQGASVYWILSGAQPGTYTITARVDDGYGYRGRAMTKPIIVRMSENCDRPVDPCICPTMSIEASAASIKAGETVTFSAKLALGSASEPDKYNWTISGGMIVEGQGTSEIKVKTTSDMPDALLTATVEIDAAGICLDCSRTASESISVRKK